MPPKMDFNSASPEVQKRYRELQAEMAGIENQLIEEAKDGDETPAGATQLNMQQLDELMTASVKKALEGLSIVDRKHGFLPTDAAHPDDLTKLTKEERVVRFLKAVFIGDARTAVALGKGHDGSPGVKQHGLVEGTPASGGYLVPDEFMAEVLRIAKSYGLARRYSRIVPMGSDVMLVPTAGATGVSVYWPGEATAGTASHPNFGQKTLTAKQLVALSQFSYELLEDSAVDVVAYIYDLFAEAIAKEEDTQWLRGSGSPFTGILANTSVNTVTMGSGKTGFTNVHADDFLDMIYAVEAAARMNARFTLHGDTIKTIRKLKDNNGQYIYDRPQGSQPATLWGYPVDETDVMPSVTDSAPATKFVSFGNGRYTLFGDRKRITVAISDDAVIATVSMFETAQRAMRLIERISIVLGIPDAYSVLKTAAA